MEQFNTRRQLTPVQQTHILSDVQQHQHRFSFPQNQLVDQRQTKNFPHKSPAFQVEPAISKQLPTQTSIIVQRPSQQTQQHYQFNQHTQQSQNSFRTAIPPVAANTATRPNEQHLQHHTQTNFIPNFSAQQQQPATRTAHNVQFPQNPQFSGPQPTQQLSQSFHQQPLNQRSIQSQYPQQQQTQQKPFHPSIQFPPSSQEQLLPTVLAPAQPSVQFVQQQPTFEQPPAPIQFVQPAQPQFVQPAQPQFAQTNYQQQQFVPQPVLAQQQPTTLQSQLLQQQNRAQFEQAAILRQQQPQYQQIDPSQQIIANPQPQQQKQFFTNVGSAQQQLFQTFPQQQSYFVDSKSEEERIREKQKIIQKHEQFVHKQHQKQQSRVKQQHEEFLAKQRKIKSQNFNSGALQPSNQYSQYSRGRQVQAYESDAFQRALKIYQENHPTTPVPTTTPAATTLADIATSTANRPVKTGRSRTKPEQDITDEDLEQFLKNHRQKLYGELKQELEASQTKPSSKSKSKVKSTKPLGRDDLLKQLKLALAESPQQELGNKTYDTMDIVLPDGQKVQVIRTTDPKLIEGATPLNNDNNQQQPQYLSPEKLIGTTPQPAKAFYENFANNGFVPEGADYEIIKQSEDGALQPVGKDIPNKKKVTFVYLEEQNDGSFKVQGVKGNDDKEAKTSGAEVDNILKKIKNGDIKLPPPSNTVTSPAAQQATATSSQFLPSSVSGSTRFESSTATSIRSSPSSGSSITPVINYGSSLSPYSTLSTASDDDDDQIYLTASSSTNYPSSTTVSPSTYDNTASSARYSSFHSSSFATTPSTPVENSSVGPTFATSPSSIYDRSPSSVYDRSPSSRFDISQSTAGLDRHSTSAPSSHFPSSTATPLRNHSPSSLFPISSTASSINEASANYADQPSSSSSFNSAPSSTLSPPINSPSEATFTQVSGSPYQVISSAVSQSPDGLPQNDLSAILKGRGLHAMAKYLKQSGLDSILNETGPYTVFAPTDKAFKSLLVQLGGPERAEEKFKSNPRLLSGVI